jgi:hypothetical protein
MGYVIDVNSARSDISGDQYSCFPVFKILQRILPGIL